ncbi:MAG: hypothetical protein PVG26_12195 [Desulfobacterales bacterium]|jgi:hypothetical protein
MGLPGAFICHQSPQRLRIKIASQKGNAEYFDQLQNTLAPLQTFDRLEVNALTGSVLLVDKNLNVDHIVEHARDLRLFDLMDQNDSRSSITTQLVSNLGDLNNSIRRLTSGDIDLVGTLLLVLLISGLTELIRGNLRMPPWYTAFWYAFGLYKLASVVEEKTRDKG